MRRKKEKRAAVVKMAKRVDVKKATTYRIAVCDCGCGSVNLVLEDENKRAFAAAQIHPTTILVEWTKIAEDALVSKPNPDAWDRAPSVN